MLHAPETLLLGGGDEFAVAHETRGGIAVVGIESEDEHFLVARVCVRRRTDKRRFSVRLDLKIGNPTRG
jgi:hypothetical protein